MSFGHGGRRPGAGRPIEKALAAGKDRFGARRVHFSVQGNHLHLVFEADDWRALPRAVKGLSVRLARVINKAMKRRGRVFSDRYHVHVLKTPREALERGRVRAPELAQARRRGPGVDPTRSARSLFVRALLPGLVRVGGRLGGRRRSGGRAAVLDHPNWVGGGRFFCVPTRARGPVSETMIERIHHDEHAP
jgi:hypothetical protein